MVITGTPDFSRTPQVQTTAVMVNLLGTLSSGSAPVTATAPMTDTTMLAGMLGVISWAGGGGPIDITTTFTFTGNLGGSFHITVGVEAPGGSPVGYSTPFTFPTAIPVRLASLLGVTGNTILTVTATSVISGGNEIVSANMILIG